MELKKHQGIFEQIDLTNYVDDFDSSFHVNADYNFESKSWKWNSGDEVKDTFWARDDKWYYPIEDDLLQETVVYY